MIDVYMERVKHPYLLALAPVAGVLLSLSFVAELLGFAMVAGFLALYTVNTLAVLVLGYVAHFALKYSTQGLRRWRVRGAETDTRRPT